MMPATWAPNLELNSMPAISSASCRATTCAPGSIRDGGSGVSSLGVVGQGIGTVAAGALIIAACHVARRSDSYLNRTRDALVRRHNRPGTDRHRMAAILRATLVYGMAFGGLVVLIGIISIIVGLGR